MLKRAYVYIDGFNFYYGAVKDTPYKWLNFRTLCEKLLPNNDILYIKYVTADIKPRHKDPQQDIRQEKFLEALKTLPNFEIIKGKFLQNKVFMPMDKNPEKKVQVIKTEEKGSDVNLAVHMVHDAHIDKYDVAVLMSNDSDFLEAIKIVKQLHKVVGVVNPQDNKYLSVQLKNQADFFRSIRKGVLEACQFPSVVYDKSGKKIRKPAVW